MVRKPDTSGYTKEEKQLIIDTINNNSDDADNLRFFIEEEMLLNV